MCFLISLKTGVRKTLKMKKNKQIQFFMFSKMRPFERTFPNFRTECQTQFRISFYILRKKKEQTNDMNTVSKANFQALGPNNVYKLCLFFVERSINHHELVNVGS